MRRHNDLLRNRLSTFKPQKVFTFDFIDVDSKLHLELMNTTAQTLKHIEVLTVFLRDETAERGPSLAHIRFEPVDLIKPQEKVLVHHRTWSNGKPAPVDQDQLKRLALVPGTISPYVLDISWQDAEGKSRYQRIPVGH
jgi:hypothetical protein